MEDVRQEVPSTGNYQRTSGSVGRMLEWNGRENRLTSGSRMGHGVSNVMDDCAPNCCSVYEGVAQKVQQVDGFGGEPKQAVLSIIAN